MLRVQVLRTTDCFLPFSFLSYDSYHVFWVKMTTWCWGIHSSHNPELPRISKTLRGVPRISFNKIKSQTCFYSFHQRDWLPGFWFALLSDTKMTTIEPGLPFLQCLDGSVSVWTWSASPLRRLSFILQSLLSLKQVNWNNTNNQLEFDSWNLLPIIK